MNQEKIGKFIQELRKEKGLTQVELAEKLGVSNRTVSKWENGNNLPDYSMFNILCEELNISINELLSGEKLTKENYQKKLEENFVSTIDYNNKKRNKKIKRFIGLIIFILIIYFLYKAFIVYHCHTLKKITHFCVIFYETISFKNLIFFNIKVEITLNINIIIVKIGIPIIEFIEL